MTGKELLNITFESRDLGRTLTLREYFVELLRTLWREDDQFSGKRPFGNSGWQWDVYIGLGKHVPNLVIYDAEGEVEDYDEKECERMIRMALDTLAEN